MEKHCANNVYVLDWRALGERRKDKALPASELDGSMRSCIRTAVTPGWLEVSAGVWV